MKIALWLTVLGLPPLVACSSASNAPLEGSTLHRDSGALSGDGAVGNEDGSMGDHDAKASGDSPSGDGSRADGSGDGSLGADGNPEGADGGDGGAMSDASPLQAASCNPATVWGTGALLAVSTAADDTLGSITPDELTIAWSTPQNIFYADRAVRTDPFGAPQTVGAGPFAAERAALSPNGLRLVVVNADLQGFSEMTRTSRMGAGSTFGAAGTGFFANLNQAGVLQAGQSYGDPVISASDTAFYLSIYGNGATATIWEAGRLSGTSPWGPPAQLSSPSELAAQGSQRRRPTGVSADEQTLFFWDEVMSMERAGWIDLISGNFVSFADLGNRSNAEPNVACTTLYYSAPGTSSVDLFAAPNQ